MANVIVTGGSRGLGLGIAPKLAMTGHHVVAIAGQLSDHWRHSRSGQRPPCMATGSGRIVNVSSIASLRGLQQPLGLWCPQGLAGRLVGSGPEAEFREKLARRSALRRQATVGDVADEVDSLLSELRSI